MIKAVFQYVSINKIEPLYIEQVSKSRIERYKRTINKVGYLDLPMIVQKDPLEDKYWLIAGYPEYKAYKDLKIIDAPSLVQPFSNATEQRITLLRRMFNNQNTAWIDKHIQIQKFIDEDKDCDYIAKQLAIVNSSDVKYYLIPPDIPDDVIKKAFLNHASFPNLEQIRRLDITRALKDRLYEKTVKQRMDKDRLTGEKLQKIKWLLQIDSFYLLNRNKQWKMLEYAINYKETLLTFWYDLIDTFLNDDDDPPKHYSAHPPFPQ